MARIRTIKPEFFTSEDVVALSPRARLLYIACWCESDRNGRMEWKPGTMKLRYFPGDACDIDALAEELIDRGMVVLYEVDGRQYAEIPSFERHQIINNRESASVLPPNPDASLTRGARVKAEGRKERKGGRVVSSDDTPPPGPEQEPREHTGVLDANEAERTPVASLPLVDGTVYVVDDAKVAEWAPAYPAVDVPQQLAAMVAWLNANPKNRKTRSGIERFIVGWLAKQQNQAHRQPGRPAEATWAGAL